jgi:transposase
MAKKGQKFRKINIEIKLEICRRHFEEGASEGVISKDFDLPIGTVRTIFNNYKKGYGFERKKGSYKRPVTLEDYKERFSILKKYQAFLKAQRRKK